MNVNAIQIGKQFYPFLNGVMPVALGTAIYLLFRDTSLLVFAWVEAVGMSEALFELRVLCKGFGAQLPEHILYSLPDGCWVWGMTAVYRSFWSFRTREGCFWICLGCGLGMGGEFGQFVGVVPGHFDWWDVGYMALGFLIPCHVVSAQ